MKKCKVCNETIVYENAIRYHNYPGIQKICKVCKRKQTKEYNRKKYEIIKNNPLW